MQYAQRCLLTQRNVCNHSYSTFARVGNARCSMLDLKKWHFYSKSAVFRASSIEQRALPTRCSMLGHRARKRHFCSELQFVNHRAARIASPMRDARCSVLGARTEHRRQCALLDARCSKNGTFTGKVPFDERDEMPDAGVQSTAHCLYVRDAQRSAQLSDIPTRRSKNDALLRQRAPRLLGRQGGSV